MVIAATEGVISRCPAELLAGIRAVVGKNAGWRQTAAMVAAELGRNLPAPGILTAAERAGDPDRHAQHILHVEPCGSFSIAGLVWRPGQLTRIHDHVTWCVIGVLAGVEHEELYELPGGEPARYLRQTANRANPAGSVGGFAPPGDIHRVRNSGNQVAISIHIYGTDISRLGSSVRRYYDLPVLPAWNWLKPGIGGPTRSGGAA